MSNGRASANSGADYNNSNTSRSRLFGGSNANSRSNGSPGASEDRPSSEHANQMAGNSLNGQGRQNDHSPRSRQSDDDRMEGPGLEISFQNIPRFPRHSLQEEALGDKPSLLPPDCHGVAKLAMPSANFHAQPPVSSPDHLCSNHNKPRLYLKANPFYPQTRDQFGGPPKPLIRSPTIERNFGKDHNLASKLKMVSIDNGLPPWSDWDGHPLPTHLIAEPKLGARSQPSLQVPTPHDEGRANPKRLKLVTQRDFFKSHTPSPDHSDSSANRRLPELSMSPHLQDLPQNSKDSNGVFSSREPSPNPRFRSESGSASPRIQSPRPVPPGGSESPPPSNTKKPQNLYQTPKRNSKASRRGDVSVDQIINQKYSEDNRLSSAKMHRAMAENYLGESDWMAQQQLGYSQLPQLVLDNEEGFRASLLAHQLREEEFNSRRVSGRLSIQHPPGRPNQSPVASEAFRSQVPPGGRFKLQPVPPMVLMRERSNSYSLSKAGDLAPPQPTSPNPLGSMSPVEPPLSKFVSEANFPCEFAPKREKLVYLCHGDFGIIYRFLSATDRQDYILKVLNGKPKAAIREARLMGLIRRHCSSKYIVGYYCSWVEDDSVMLMLESCRASADLHWSKESCSLTYADLGRFVLHAAKGLKELHSANVVHLDVKPANVLVAKNGNFKLCDFGNARLITSVKEIEDIDEGDFLYTPAEFKGDVSWQEVQSGAVDLTKVDVYSLGISAMELAFRTEGVKYEREDLEEARLGRTGKLNSLSRCPPPLRELIYSMISPRQRDRPTAAAVVACIKLHDLAR